MTKRRNDTRPEDGTVEFDDPTHVAKPRDTPAKFDVGAFAASCQASIEKRWAESPFKCAGGCGSAVLKDRETCDACKDRARDKRQRFACLAITSAELPESYRWAHFSAPELPLRVKDARAVAAAKVVARIHGVDRIVLFGPAGAGKTSLAACSLHQLSFDRKISGLYVDARSLSLARSRSGLGREAPLVADAMTCDLLLIDDIGLDRSDQYGSAVAEIIYARHSERRATISTLAVEPAAIATLYGDGIARRVFEGAAKIEVSRP
jgi:DNA replication protein DnaC